MDNIAPIRSDVAPQLDVEREMLDFVALQLQSYRADYGCAPASIALVLVGDATGDEGTDATSWTPANDRMSRLHVCAIAAAVLWKRALGV